VVDLGKYRFAGQPGAVGTRVHAAVDLGRQHDLVRWAYFEDLPTISSLLPSEYTWPVEEVDARLEAWRMMA